MWGEDQRLVDQEALHWCLRGGGTHVTVDGTLLFAVIGVAVPVICACTHRVQPAFAFGGSGFERVDLGYVVHDAFDGGSVEVEFCALKKVRAKVHVWAEVGGRQNREESSIILPHLVKPELQHNFRGFWVEPLCSSEFQVKFDVSSRKVVPTHISTGANLFPP